MPSATEKNCRYGTKTAKDNAVVLRRFRDFEANGVVDDDARTAKRARTSVRHVEKIQYVESDANGDCSQDSADGSSTALSIGSTTVDSADSDIDIDTWIACECCSDLDCLSKIDETGGDTGGRQASCGPRRANTLVLCDWDDTLFPFSWLRQQGLSLGADSQPTEEQWNILKQVARSTVRVLRTARRHGRVVLVTNAEHGWVQLSCRKFFPWLSPALDGLKVLSARSEYERVGVTSPFEWKFRVFESEIRKKNWSPSCGANVVSNVISIGDGSHERQALFRAATGVPNFLAKSVKLVERPRVSQLLKQHALLGACFHGIARHTVSLDLCFQFD